MPCRREASVYALAVRSAGEHEHVAFQPAIVLERDAEDDRLYRPVGSNRPSSVPVEASARSPRSISPFSIATSSMAFFSVTRS